MKKAFSGARPTGRQHIGNYLGAIRNYVALQNEGLECLYCVVDVHALTTLEETKELQDNIREMVLDWLAAGLDPERSIIFVQSHVPEVMELFTFLGMITPLGWLLRVPTFKEKVRGQPHNVNYGLVGYPVLMAADILLYKAEIIPVGEDQIPHIELVREIARRFNHLFGPTFPEPEARLSDTPLILGLDGQGKMSKSLGNHLELAATPEEIRAKIMKAYTDPARRYRSDPGHPEICNIFRLHTFFTSKEQREEIERECRRAGIGCVDCKKILIDNMNSYLAPFREKRAELSSDPKLVREILAEGARKAKRIAAETLYEVKEKMGLLWKN